jgi:hypothetical protein
MYKSSNHDIPRAQASAFHEALRTELIHAYIIGAGEERNPENGLAAALQKSYSVPCAPGAEYSKVKVEKLLLTF